MPYAGGIYYFNPFERETYTKEGAKEFAVSTVTGGLLGMGETVQSQYRPGEFATDPSIAEIGGGETQAFDIRAGEAQARGPAQMQAAELDAAQQAAIRGRQMGLADVMQQRVAGERPSVAELQLRAGQERNIAAARAMAAGSANPALARRAAMQQATQSNLEANQQAALLRAQEQAQAEGRLGQTLAGIRGQDVGVATTQAQLQQQAAQANLQANVQQRQMNDQLTQFYLNQGFGRDQARQQARLDAARLQQESFEAAEQRRMETAEKQAEREQTTKRGIIGAAGAALSALSDIRAKENIRGGDREVQGFMDSVRPYSYDYKDPRRGNGVTGVMAQDVERTPAGREMVIDTPEGKAIDGGRLLQMNTAATANLNDRLNRMEALSTARASNDARRDRMRTFLQELYGESGVGDADLGALEAGRDEAPAPRTFAPSGPARREPTMAARTFEPSGPARDPEEELALRTFRPSGNVRDYMMRSAVARR